MKGLIAQRAQTSGKSGASKVAALHGLQPFAATGTTSADAESNNLGIGETPSGTSAAESNAVGFAAENLYLAFLRNSAPTTPILPHSTASNSTATPPCEESNAALTALQRDHIPNIAPHNGSIKKSYACGICNKEFTRTGNRNRHERSHHRQRVAEITESEVSRGEGFERDLFRCDSSRKTFNQKRNLRTQECVHNGLKPHKCGYCGKHFQTKADIRTHKNVHTGKKPYVCVICNKEFGARSNRCQHEDRHMGSLFQCGNCGVGFDEKGAFMDHVASHKGETNVMCDLCGWRDNKESVETLKAHEESEHSYYLCCHCQKSQVRSALAVWRCLGCTRAFARAHILRKHMDARPLICASCQGDFEESPKVACYQCGKAMHERCCKRSLTRLKGIFPNEVYQERLQCSPTVQTTHTESAVEESNA